MISLFFEVEMKPGQTDRYLDLAAALKPELTAMGGCLFIDRFRSLTRDNLLLSYQIWRDEGALTAWRVHAHHHDVQTLGREKVFSDYRIRVAQVIHEARPDKPMWQPERRTPYNDPERRSEAFASVYREGRFAHLIDLPDVQSGQDFGAWLFADATTDYFRIVDVMRDYTMYDRAEAPQYYPPIDRVMS
jgi:heme-degrading monooxygenase HmoA